MSPPPIRVLVIGTGFGALVHAPGFTRHPAFTLAGVASGTLENAKRVASEFSVPYATDDWKRMLEEVDADLVSIATPVDQHYPMARAALAAAKGRVNVVNHEFRHYPARETLTRKIREGALGRVEHITIRDRIPGW